MTNIPPEVLKDFWQGADVFYLVVVYCAVVASIAITIIAVSVFIKWAQQKSFKPAPARRVQDPCPRSAASEPTGQKQPPKHS